MDAVSGIDWGSADPIEDSGNVVAESGRASAALPWERLKWGFLRSSGGSAEILHWEVTTAGHLAQTGSAAGRQTASLRDVLWRTSTSKVTFLEPTCRRHQQVSGRRGADTIGSQCT
jgi:hypothetical protein